MVCIPNKIPNMLAIRFSGMLSFVDDNARILKGKSSPIFYTLLQGEFELSLKALMWGNKKSVESLFLL